MGRLLNGWSFGFLQNLGARLVLHVWVTAVVLVGEEGLGLPVELWHGGDISPVKGLALDDVVPD